MGGPGEKQIESDKKRQLTEKINRLKKIKKIVSIRDIPKIQKKKIKFQL